MDSGISNSQIKQQYAKYKMSPNFPFAVGGIIIVISILLFLQVTLPQFQGWMQMQQDIQTTREHVAMEQQNLSKIQALDPTVLSQDFDLTRTALPGEKDYGGVLNAISSSAVNAGIGLDDFFFSVGNLATGSADMNGKLPIRIQLTLKGTPDGANSFIKEVEKKLPLGRVFSVEGTDGSIDTVLQFYNDPLPNTQFNKDTYATPIKVDVDRNLLDNLKAWRDSEVTTDLNSLQVGSGSGTVPPLSTSPF